MISILEILEENDKESKIDLIDIDLKKPKKKDIEKTIRKDIIVNNKKVKFTFVKTKDNLIVPVKIEKKNKEKKESADVSK